MSVGLPDEGKEDRLMKPAGASAIPPDMEQARQELLRGSFLEPLRDVVRHGRQDGRFRSRTPPLSCQRPTDRTKSVPNTGEYTGISRY